MVYHAYVACYVNTIRTCSAAARLIIVVGQLLAPIAHLSDMRAGRLFVD